VCDYVTVEKEGLIENWQWRSSKKGMLLQLRSSSR